MSAAIFVLVFLIFTISSGLILHVERDSGGEINTAADALWWALLNVLNAKTSIDNAVTTEGQAITILLNKIGLLIFTFLNGLVIAWLLKIKSN